MVEMIFCNNDCTSTNYNIDRKEVKSPRPISRQNLKMLLTYGRLYRDDDEWVLGPPHFNFHS